MEKSIPSSPPYLSLGKARNSLSLKRSREFLALFITLFSFLFISITPVYADIPTFGPLARRFLGIGRFWGIGYFTTIALTNVIFETITLFFLGLKKRREVFSVVISNAISWPLFAVLEATTSQFLLVVILEVVVILFETLFIYFFNRELKLTKLLLKILVANVLSATLGQYIFSIFTFGIIFTIIQLVDKAFISVFGYF